MRVERRILGSAAHDDGAQHAGRLVHVLVGEVAPGLHVDERLARGVPRDGDAVPVFVSVAIADDVADEHDGRTDLGENRRRVVAVVGLAAADRLVGTRIIGVLRHRVVLHEVHHVDGAVFLGWAGGEVHPVFLVDGAVLVLQSRCVSHVNQPRRRA